MCIRGMPQDSPPLLPISLPEVHGYGGGEKHHESEDGGFHMAVIDMGSNGIRFSITDMEPGTRRTLPLVYQDRVDISLYDEQHHGTERSPIPQNIIDEVIVALNDFKEVCQGYGVPTAQILMVATEATRAAINSKSFLDQIRKKTGLSPTLLSKDQEGYYGAIGIASSMTQPAKGLAVDLGGGSIQLSEMMQLVDGTIQIGASQSFPYGAAAVTSKLNQANSQAEKSAISEAIYEELEAFLSGLPSLNESLISKSAESAQLSIFLSGGGMRRWGHLLMLDDSIQPYPIPIINGYSVSGSKLLSPDESSFDKARISHRISKRGQAQLPAIHLVLSALVKSLPCPITTATFCQGGIREGILYDLIPAQERTPHPFTAASRHLATAVTARITHHLLDALPTLPTGPSNNDRSQQQHQQRMEKYRALIPALANLIYDHSSLTKDIRASSALRCSTSGHDLANIHGLSHFDRAFLALVLCERWGGEGHVARIDRPFLDSLRRTVSVEDAWWAMYLGWIAQGLAALWPSGKEKVRIDDGEDGSEADGSSGGVGGRGGLQIKVDVPTVEVPERDGKQVLVVRLTVRHRRWLQKVQNWAEELEKKVKWKKVKRDFPVGVGGDGDDGIERGWKLEVHVVDATN